MTFMDYFSREWLSNSRGWTDNPVMSDYTRGTLRSRSFVLRFDVRDHPSDPLRAALPVILAADRFALSFDRGPEPDRPLLWVAAPAARECVLETLVALGV